VTMVTLLFFDSTLSNMYLASICSVMSDATSSVYLTYAFRVVPPELCAAAAACPMAALHLGSLLRAVLAIVLKSSCQDLYIVFWAFTWCSCVAFWFLPGVWSAPGLQSSASMRDGFEPPRRGTLRALMEFLRLYMDPVILSWSCFWWFAYSAAQSAQSSSEALLFEIGRTGRGGDVNVEWANVCIEALTFFLVLLPALRPARFRTELLWMFIAPPMLLASCAAVIAPRMSSFWSVCIVSTCLQGLLALMISVAAGNTAAALRGKSESRPRYTQTIITNCCISVGASRVFRWWFLLDDVLSDSFHVVAVSCICAAVSPAVVSCVGECGMKAFYYSRTR